MAEEGQRWGARASLAELVEAQHAAFAARYGEPPVETASAPGRINVIGGHTDYNQGLALPGAIDRWVVVTLSPRRDDAKRLHSEAFGETVVVPVSLFFDALGREPDNMRRCRWIAALIVVAALVVENVGDTAVIIPLVEVKSADTTR